MSHSPTTAWLQPFPEDVRRRVSEWIEPGTAGAAFVTPAPILARFRMNAGSALAEVRKTLDRLWQSLPPPGRVIWALENADNRGLDDFEVEAVFAPWLDIDLLEQVAAGSSLSKVLVAGRLREEVVGLAVRIDTRTQPRAEHARRVLELLSETGLTMATLFIESSEAAAIVRNRDSGLRRAIQQFLKINKAGLGLWVSRSGPETASEGLAMAFEPLKELGQRDVQHVRFEDPLAFGSPLRFHDVLNQLPDLCDSTIQNSYVSGAYQPQPFDLRTPAGLWRPSQCIELAYHPWNSSASVSQWKSFWDSRLGRNVEPLQPLLDYRRMESYFSRSATDPRLNQQYSDYRVYNWQRPDPTPRCTLLDCGFLDRLQVLSLDYRIRKVADRFGFRWHITGHDGLLAAAREEAERRAATQLTSIFHDQIENHSYLSTISVAEPLRQDVRNFSEFIPHKLGRTLEIGSGRGSLARALAPRSEVYICLELASVRPGDNESGGLCWNVAADAHQLPFAESSFDTVVANNILEHLYEPLTALKDIHRTLKPGGKLFALVPLDQLNPRHNIRTHLWKADEQSIRAVLAVSGLAPLRMEIIDLYALGVEGCFPTCNGLVCKVEAVRER